MDRNLLFFLVFFSFTSLSLIFKNQTGNWWFKAKLLELKQNYEEFVQKSPQIFQIYRKAQLTKSHNVPKPFSKNLNHFKILQTSTIKLNSPKIIISPNGHKLNSQNFSQFKLLFLPNYQLNLFRVIAALTFSADQLSCRKIIFYCVK